MFKKILTVLSLVALMATSFVVSPVATKASTVYPYGPFTLFSGTIFVSDSNDVNGVFPCGVCDDGEEFTPYSVIPILNEFRTSILNALSYAEVTITATSAGHDFPLIVLANGIQQNVSTYKVNGIQQNSSTFNAYGSDPEISIKSEAQGNTYEATIEATIYFTTPVLNTKNYNNSYSNPVDGSALGIDGNGVIFDGFIFINHGAVIEYPISLLADFETTKSVCITSFNVYAPGLFIGIQGLYQCSSDYGSLSFFDWIGKSPIPRWEEEEFSYLWYIDLSGATGWYYLKISVDFV